MSNGEVNLQQFDDRLKDGSDVAALVMRQWLEPVEGKDAVIFPPTYAKPEDWRREKEWLGYNVDLFEDGSTVCQIDSVGSQANRMEPIFKREEYRRLVPQVIIKAGDREVHLLEAGHRAADAIARFSDLKNALDSAFKALKAGNAEPLARIAPTSLVFGAWDSRETQVKVPRIVRSVIRAFNVRVLHRSAQYSTIAGEVLAGGEAPVASGETKESQLGLAHVPAPWTHGGILVLGEIRRDAALNLSALRALAGSTDEAKLKLRRYILGLALVSFTAPPETSLREGCQLVPDAERPVEWRLVRHDGKRGPISLSHSDALQYAQRAAEEFKVGPDRIATFDSKAAREAQAQSKDERRRARRSGSGAEEG